MRIGFRERDGAPHERNGRDAVPSARHDEHRLDRARAVARLADELGARAFEHQLRRRDLARAELVLQALDANAVQAAIGIARLDVEHREPAAARPIAVRTRESVSAICEVIAEVNHFLPYNRHAPCSSRRALVQRRTDIRAAASTPSSIGRSSTPTPDRGSSVAVRRDRSDLRCLRR